MGVQPRDGAGSSPSALGARIRYIEALLHTLRDAGFTAAQAYYAYHALDSYAVGFTMWELGHAVPDTAAVEPVIRQIESCAIRTSSSTRASTTPTTRKRASSSVLI